MSSKKTVLITGLNGYVAARTAEAVLREGYRVRGTVRNPAAGEKVRETLVGLGFDPDDIEVIHVPDVSTPRALDRAVAGCIAILHIASPFGEIWTLPPSEIVRIAVESTSSILNAATKAGPQLQSVVYVSSAAALFNTPVDNKTHTEEDWNTTSEKLVEELGSEAGGFNAYCASKTAAEKVFWKFHDEQEPSFGMTALQPTYIVGEPLIPWETREQVPYSMSPFMKVLAGEDVPGPMMLYEDTIDIRDVVRMVVWSAMNPRQAGGERFICSSAVGGGQAIMDILKRDMPSLATQAGNTGQGYRPDFRPRGGVVGFDQSKAVRVTGQRWIPYETTVVDLAKFLQRYIN
ncbi:hypothetical protein F4775DRAFT_283882 [Biscogniauxia sp. FL1348]|nr:hypothetical protein F4775DRAFT_283882 [Biscogniauxia sp. FL1348]